MYDEEAKSAELEPSEYRKGSIGASLEAAPDRPMSSTESAMLFLEAEIMKLDETLNGLRRRLKPVLNDSIAKATESPTHNDEKMRAESVLARSIREKGDRIRMIRNRVQGLTEAVDV